MIENAPTVLLVDGDVEFQNWLETRFTEKGFAVQKLATEAEAEEHLKNNRPDIVVMGLMLEYPDSGFILSHRIKQKDPALPIIMVTSVARKMGFSFEAATEEERSWVKADVVMDEPVRFEQLWNEAEKLLRRN